MLDQMNTEVEVLSQVQHPNIVPLLGWSKEGAAPCLVYTLMEGGSLQDRLACTHGAGIPLTAKERIVVLSDVARGLAYLHSEISPPVIHRDVKRWTSSNVSFLRCTNESTMALTFENFCQCECAARSRLHWQNRRLRNR